MPDVSLDAPISRNDPWLLLDNCEQVPSVLYASVHHFLHGDESYFGSVYFFPSEEPRQLAYRGCLAFGLAKLSESFN